jgi:proteasome accessory factor B
MQKAERLLDLAAFLLRAAEPVAWREIQEQFPDDYGGSEEAAIRKFERDKAELLELGIPVRWQAQDEDLPAGYVIERDEFYLPNLELAPEDLALLYMAGSAALAQGAFPYAKDLAHALNKLSFAARAPGASETAALAARQLSGDGESARPGDGGPLARKREELSAAVMAKKRVHLVYQGAERGAATERDVDPYGLYQSGGAWFVVGHCHLRKDVRTFHLARIAELTVNAAAPRTRDFVVPETFQLGALATRETWEYAVHAPERCTVRLEAPVSPDARASFGPRAVVREQESGATVELTVTNGEALVRHVLALGERAQVVSPPRWREKARAILEDLTARCA